MRGPVVPFFISHRGCPHQCVFCDQVTISGEDGAFPSRDDILGKIAAWRDSAGGRPVEAAFFGGTFTSLPLPVQERLLAPLQPLIATGEVTSIRVSTRPDAIDPAIVRFLKSMGVATVELGVQSMDDDVLQRAGRGHTAADVEVASSLLREAGMVLGMQLMPGLPGDTPERSVGSLKRVLALQPDFIRIYPTIVIAGTQLEELYRQGAYAPLSLKEAVIRCKIMLHLALKARVPVIRMGLQPTDELNAAGAVVAGPYHPAFRQLVAGELFYDLSLRLLDGLPADSHVILYSAPGRIADVTGHRRSNLSRLFTTCGVKIEAVKGRPDIAPSGLIVAAGEFVRRGDIIADLDYTGGTSS